MTRILLVPDLPQEGWPSMDRYASRLYRHLCREASQFTYELAGPVATLTDERPDGNGRQSLRYVSPLPSSRTEWVRYLNRYARYPRSVRKRDGELVHVLDHSYGHLLAAEREIPQVVTVHDLLPAMQIRERSAGWRERVRNHFLRRSLDGLRQATAWIVGTQWMRGELANWLGRDDGIHVIPFGVDDAFFGVRDGSGNQARSHFAIARSAFVILHVGSTVERKNLPCVLETLAHTRRRGVDAVLLQVGGQFTSEQDALIAALNIDPFIRQHPVVSEAVLHAAYRAADVLLFPSRYEGFGLPLLEAMAAGVPVVTSAIPAPAEVVGDAGLVIDGWDADRYADALARLASEPTHADDLRRRGAERARQFTWAETARRTAALYGALV